MSVDVEFMRMVEDAKLPTFGSSGAAGMDLYASACKHLMPGEWGLVPTGLKIALEHGYEAQIRPRSGLALKHGVTVLNAPGTIDSDYRGEVGVILINHNPEPYMVLAGDRIAQLVVSPVCPHVRPKFVERFSRAETGRGEGGYGSTGS